MGAAQALIPNPFLDLISLQRAKPATKREMSQFHSDEYVDFLNRINPTNMNSYIREQLKCMSTLLAPPDFSLIRLPLQTTLGMTVLYLMVCSIIVLFPLGDPWVSVVLHPIRNRHYLLIPIVQRVQRG